MVDETSQVCYTSCENTYVLTISLTSPSLPKHLKRSVSVYQRSMSYLQPLNHHWMESLLYWNQSRLLKSMTTMSWNQFIKVQRYIYKHKDFTGISILHVTSLQDTLDQYQAIKSSLKSISKDKDWTYSSVVCSVINEKVKSTHLIF